MKKRKKISFIIAALLFLILVGTGTTKASSGDLYLNDLAFEVQVQEDGSMDVTEIWDIDIEETNTLYKTFKTDKSRYSRITNVKVTDITNGKNMAFKKIGQEMYHVTKGCYYGLINQKGLFEIAWGVGLDNSSATRKYKIQYTVEDAIAKYQDKAELYWQFVGEDFEINARKVTGTITLPQNATLTDEIRVWGHTEDLNGEIYVTSPNTIAFEVKGRNRGRFIEIRTLFPTEMITSSERGEKKERLQEVIQEETVWAEEANQRRERKQLLKNIIATVEGIIALVLCGVLIKEIRKKAKVSKEIIKYKPTQEIIYYREMPREDATPAEALYLYKKQIGEFQSTEIGKIFSATLLDLSLKKYLSFEVEKKEKRKENIIIQLQKETLEETLSKEEAAILKFVKQAAGNSNIVTVKELEKYIQKSQTKVVKLKDTVDKETENRIQEKSLVDKKEKEKYNQYMVQIVGMVTGLVASIIIGCFTSIFMNVVILAAIIPLIILEIVYLIILCQIQSKINVFTQEGVEESEKWKGLKRYMENFSMMDKKEVPELILWEKFLVYATVFGIAEKVLKQLKIVYPNMEEVVNMNNYTCLYFMTHTNFTSSFSNSISTSMSSSYSSATGGGGGFSGGGGGGRRPEEAGEVGKILLYSQTQYVI